MRTRKKYERDFKEKAVQLCTVRGNVQDVASELGIVPGLLRRWRREFLQYSANSFPGHGKAKLTDEQRELSQLRRELRDMRMERDILKKAISIFSVRDGKSTSL